MKNLKLNQLNKQKVTESEMNGIKGGMITLGWAPVVPAGCTSRCTDTEWLGTGFTPSYDSHGAMKSDFYETTY